MKRFFDHLSAAQMHASDLLQLAAILAVQSPKLKAANVDPAGSYLGSYWSASEQRIDSWNQQLRLHSKEQTTRFNLTQILQEIILSEPLTRIWTAIITSGCDFQDGKEAVAAAKRMMNLHLDVHYRGMALLSRGNGHEETVADLVKLEHRTERWTDLLLAHVEQSYPAIHLAPNRERSLDFFQDLQYQSGRAGYGVASAITLSTMRETICCNIAPQSPHASLNFQIGATIVESCEVGELQSEGLFESLWAIRLVNRLAECQKMVASYLSSGHNPLSTEH